MKTNSLSDYDIFKKQLNSSLCLFKIQNGKENYIPFFKNQDKIDLREFFTQENFNCQEHIIQKHDGQNALLEINIYDLVSIHITSINHFLSCDAFLV